MEKKEKQVYLYIAFAIGLFGIVVHLERVVTFLGYINDLFMPVLVGGVLAFMLNVPVTGFENLLGRIFAKAKRKPSEKRIHLASILLSLVSVLAVIAVLCVLVIPELAKTVKSIVELVETNWPSWLAILESYNINTDGMKQWFISFDWKNIIGQVSGYAGNVIGSIASAASSTVAVISVAVTGIIIAIYFLIDRNKLAVQAKGVLYAYAKVNVAEKIIYVCRLIQKTYMKFFTGQCVEAVILGLLIAISFSIFRLPYAALVGTVTAICALVPYIGAFISCTLGVILSLMVSPQKAILCLIVYLAVQFVEAQFIYPHVVGSSVGLSPLWTLLAILIGGKLFGLAGIIFFIPLVSVIYVLVKEDVTKRLERKSSK